MSRFIESICLKDGKLQNIEYHNARLNRTIKEVLNKDTDFKLENLISISKNLQNGIYKVRVIYYKDIEEIEIQPYNFRRRDTLKIVFSDLNYRYKYEDRNILNRLFEKRGGCDDILIVKNDRPTDTFASNIVFFDGERWFTPVFPLLRGTKRQLLLDKKIILEKDIKLSELKNFKGFRLINAMLDWEDSYIPITNIKGF
ncbi:MAG: aminotransferase class IV [Brevinematia bacterium]